MSKVAIAGEPIVSADLAMTSCSGEIASLGEGVKVEVIRPDCRSFMSSAMRRSARPMSSSRRTTKSGAHSFRCRVIGHRLPLHLAGDEELAPLPDIIARRFPSLCGGRHLP